MHRRLPFLLILLFASGAGCKTPDHAGDDGSQVLSAQGSGNHLKDSEIAVPVVRTDRFQHSNVGKTIDDIDHLNVCSFNISFLGHWRAEEKQSDALADLLVPCDVVVIQELTSPPLFGAVDVQGRFYEWFPKDTCPESAQVRVTESEEYCAEKVKEYGEWWSECTPPPGIRTSSSGYKAVGPNFKEEVFKADCQARVFFGAMHQRGFSYVISPGDTGKTSRHVNTTSSEWFVAFYRSEFLEPIPAGSGPTGWTIVDRNGSFSPCRDGDPAESATTGAGSPLSYCLVKNPVFDRVPYAFAFRTKPRADGKSSSFVLISVHLIATERQTSAGLAEGAERRRAEFRAIYDWIRHQMELYPERDYIILGDTNIGTVEEFEELMNGPNNPLRFVSLNDALHRTNTGAKPMPYDHVLFNPEETPVARASDGRLELEILDITAPELFDYDGVMEGNQNAFFKAYSDHVPVKFRLLLEDQDEWSQAN